MPTRRGSLLKRSWIKNFRRYTRLSFSGKRTFGVLVRIMIAVFAAGAPAAEEGCFCYQQPATEAILIGFQSFQGPHDAFPRISCRDPIKNTRYEVHPGTDWVKLESGSAGCKSCEPRVTAKEDRPRGEDEEEK
jgi:hypothetical protein